MNLEASLDHMTSELSDAIIALLEKRTHSEKRTYGFEYEFLPREIIDRKRLDEIRACLPSCGFDADGDRFLSSNGMSITFEPGGQIEYCSPPIEGGDRSSVEALLGIIEEVNRKIHRSLGILYLPVGYIPGRDKIPLCVTSKRYKRLQARMSTCGTRGLDMMKGTASIHLHVVILDTREILPIFKELAFLAKTVEFSMSSDRRDIWNHTDPTRCGMPLDNMAEVTDAHALISRIVRFALLAVDINENLPFAEKSDITVDNFLYHLTTIFTDVRLNMKGPSLELRTLDSLPLSKFMGKWDLFVSTFEHYPIT
ncbi:MAG: glutamate-cysteine ligase family protein [Desulfatiglans sp.]|jgi:glutamate--cysteine ligase|nr:glutamate-cysteine ligase family protein [Thermodesulfobacteriota bacterium]MEE4351601.1 glutamate-cysteine ligase family protein [Desulfatiglans sp.]